MERVGVKEVKEVEDMVEVGRVAREEEDTGQTYSLFFSFPPLCLCTFVSSFIWKRPG